MKATSLQVGQGRNFDSKISPSFEILSFLP